MSPFVALALVLSVAVAVPPTGFMAKLWRSEGRAAPSDVHSVVFIPKSKTSLAECDAMLMEISDASSPKWLNHYSHEEVGNMFRDRSSEARLLNFLRVHGVAKSEVEITPQGDFVTLTTTIAKLEKLLPGTEFFKYTAINAPKQQPVFRSLDYHMPASLKRFVATITDLNYLPVPRGAHQVSMSTATTRTRQSGNVSPSLLNSFYKITDNVVHSRDATASLFESLGQSFAPSDLTAFQNQFSLPRTPIAKVVGPNDPGSCTDNPNNCAEASLDVQWILAIAQNASTWFWSIPGNGDIFVQWAKAVSATSNPPLIHSLSYGSLAPEDPKFDVETFNTLMCKLSLKGLTLFVSSGDDGVANFGARGDPSACGFTPSFPATSPYATAVGATQGPEAGQPEITCSSSTNGLITSGGGFSTYVTRPAWQQTVVNDYLKNGPNVPPRNQFSALGRAYPDIAIMGHNYPIEVAGQEYVGSGTSCSAPVAAGMFTLINGMRLAAGKKPLGFLNPTIYAQGAASNHMFNDITSGVNNCCAGQEGSQTCCQYGFTATTGWDPCTGFGSINWSLASKYFAGLP